MVGVMHSTAPISLARLDAVEPRDDITSCVTRLASAERKYLRDLPGLDVPRLPGIYALWFKDQLLYTGIAKVDPSTTNNPQAAGVAGRLSTYRNCRSCHLAGGPAADAAGADTAGVEVDTQGLSAIQCSSRAWSSASSCG